MPRISACIPRALLSNVLSVSCELVMGALWDLTMPRNSVKLLHLVSCSTSDKSSAVENCGLSDEEYLAPLVTKQAYGKRLDEDGSVALTGVCLA